MEIFTCNEVCFMKRDVRQLLVATATVLATVLSGGVLAQSSAQKPSTGKWVVPRTPDGKPDLSGTWNSAQGYFTNLARDLKPGELVDRNPDSARAARQRPAHPD